MGPPKRETRSSVLRPNAGGDLPCTLDNREHRPRKTTLWYYCHVVSTPIVSQQCYTMYRAAHAMNAPPSAAIASTVTAPAQPKLPPARICIVAAAPVDVAAALDLVGVALDPPEVVLAASPTRADSFESSTKLTLMVELVHWEGASADPLTKLTATH